MDQFGNEICRPHDTSGISMKPPFDKPGPPPAEGAQDGDARFDSRMQLWIFVGGKWVPGTEKQVVYVVVAAPGDFAMPRAWAFDNEKDAVNFRLKTLDETNRRPGSLSPVFCVPVNDANYSGFQEVDWRKYPKPKPEEKTKKFM